MTRIASDSEGRAPLLALHGGPAPATTTSRSLAAISATGRRVIFYDQQGCGNSDQPDDPARWTVDFYLREVDAVREALGLERVHILGQSWGGMLLMEYLVRQPAGRRLGDGRQLAREHAPVDRGDGPAARSAAAGGHRGARAPRGGRHLGRPRVRGGREVFYHRHLCRVVPFPEPVTRSFAKPARNPQVYRTMNGPTEFHVVGTLRDWDITPRLDAVEVPTLVTSGRHDEATPARWRIVAERIPQAEWVVFEQSGHMSHAEEPDRYMAVLADFLARAEQGLAPTRAAGHSRRRRERQLPRSCRGVARSPADPGRRAG